MATINATPPPGERGWDSVQSGPASAVGPLMHNMITVVHRTNLSGSDARAFGSYMQFNTGGPNQKGAALGVFRNVHQDQNANSGRDYIAHVAQCAVSAANTGTGEHYGGNSVALALGAAASTPAIIAHEFDTQIDPGAVVQRRAGARIVNQGVSQPVNKNRDGAVWLTGTPGSIGGAHQSYLLLTKEMGEQGIRPDGSIVHDGGDAQQIAYVFNCPNLDVTEDILHFPNVRITGGGGIYAKSINLATPVVKTGTSGTVMPLEYSIVINASGPFSVAMPPANIYPGRPLKFKSVSNFPVTATTSNVVPIDSLTPGTAVLPAGVGRWAEFWSDSENWIAMAQG